MMKSARTLVNTRIGTKTMTKTSTFSFPSRRPLPGATTSASRCSRQHYRNRSSIPTSIVFFMLLEIAWIVMFLLLLLPLTTRTKMKMMLTQLIYYSKSAPSSPRMLCFPANAIEKSVYSGPIVCKLIAENRGNYNVPKRSINSSSTSVYASSR